MIALADPPENGTRAPGRSVAELIETVSASRLVTWQQCRLKFYFRYVLALVKPPTPARHVGTTVHAVLQQWNLARWRRKPLSDEDLKAVLDQEWPAQETSGQIAWEGEEDDTRQAAWNLLETYFRETTIRSDERPEGVEVSVEADLARHSLPRLVGIIDLVRAGGRIVDFKTTRTTPDSQRVAHQNEVQTTIYALLYRESTDARETGIELHHLVKLKTPKVVLTELPPATDDQVTRLFRVIESYVAGVQAGDFIPAPGLGCASCEYFRECRIWH